MNDEVFRQRKKINSNELDAMPMPDNAVKIAGNIPPQLAAMMNQAEPPKQIQEAPAPSVPYSTNSNLQEILNKLSSNTTWEEFSWASGGKFYSDIPATIHIRPMTGAEEQILATPRYIKQGTAIDKIFEQCIQEKIDTNKILLIDRAHLLIYLRGISYTPEYDVEIKCSYCGQGFSEVIDLNLDVNFCPEDFSTKNLQGKLPASDLSYSFRIPTGADETMVSKHREMRIEQKLDDDSALFRMALLIEDIQGITNKKEIQILLQKLKLQDLTHLRNEMNDIPFGADTEIDVICPSCNENFKIDLPLEASFFFPRKKEKTQA